jgi:hypothetical protein
MDTNNSENKQRAVVPADLVQQKPHVEFIVPPLAARISRRRLVAKVGKIKLQLHLSLFRGRGSAELVEKVGMSNIGIVQ